MGRKQSGITLMELLVGIAIGAIVLTIAGSQILQMGRSARQIEAHSATLKYKALLSDYLIKIIARSEAIRVGSTGIARFDVVKDNSLAIKTLEMKNHCRTTLKSSLEVTTALRQAIVDKMEAMGLDPDACHVQACEGNKVPAIRLYDPEYDRAVVWPQKDVRQKVDVALSGCFQKMTINSRPVFGLRLFMARWGYQGIQVDVSDITSAPYKNFFDDDILRNRDDL